MKIFGYIIKKEKDIEEELEIREKIIDKLKLEKEVLQLTIKERQPVDISQGDPSPKNPDARKAYVARVAGFHEEILKPKLLQLISLAQADLARFDNPPGFEPNQKGTINALWLLDDWGELMVSESRADQQDGKEQQESEDLKEQISQLINE